MEGICERIEALLRERGISGSKLSADLGMSRSFMTELRKGRAKGRERGDGGADSGVAGRYDGLPAGQVGAARPG